MRFSSAGDQDHTSPSYGGMSPWRSCRMKPFSLTTCSFCVPPIDTASFMRWPWLAMPYNGSFASVDVEMWPIPVGLSVRALVPRYLGYDAALQLSSADRDDDLSLGSLRRHTDG